MFWPLRQTIMCYMQMQKGIFHAKLGRATGNNTLLSLPTWLFHSLFFSPSLCSASDNTPYSPRPSLLTAALEATSFLLQYHQESPCPSILSKSSVDSSDWVLSLNTLFQKCLIAFRCQQEASKVFYNSFKVFYNFSLSSPLSYR